MYKISNFNEGYSKWLLFFVLDIFKFLW